MRLNNQAEPYEAVKVQLWDFLWSTFISEYYDPDQKFIFKFGDGDIIIMEHKDFIDSPHIIQVGVTNYLPIDLGE